ncbi:MAG: aminotransferase class I/II-fold pyridoxal phosphate-dependent enzyme [Pseudomonadota bacterium]
MVFPERFSNLPVYAFPRLRALLDGHSPGQDAISMSIGEPRHAFPSWLSQVIGDAAEGFGRYPPTDGTPELRQAQSDWIKRRYGVALDPETRLTPVNGTKEGLYNVAMAVCPEEKAGAQPLILVPNPFYQVYMVASLSVGAKPYFVPATAANGFLPDFQSLPADVLNRTAMVYLCSPANPQGAIASADYWANLFGLAEEYDFLVVADECYAEIYRDTPPPGALAALEATGADAERLVAFHSLSKRSNVPGLRSGFAAAGPASTKRMKSLRSYAGSPIPLPLQKASEMLWSDEAHVEANRALYKTKYETADRIFGDLQGYQPPQAGFFLWLPVEDGEAAALKLWREAGVLVLPGAYLSQSVDGANPGQHYIRVALVAEQEETERGLIRLRDCIYS